jgi:glycerophosphoryl diester phosphodiesterase
MERVCVWRFWFCAVLVLSRLSAADLPALKHSTVVIAHRGEHLRHHENTLEAIDGAVEAGADFVELDVRRSSDGRYLLMHDASVDRMTDGKGRVVEQSWEQLSKLVVRDTRLTNIPPSRIPLFEEALARCRGRIHIYLDFKAGDRAKVAAMIREAGMERGVLVYDSASGIEEWRRLAPELPLITSPPKAALTNSAALKEFVLQYLPEVLDEAPDSAFITAAGALCVKTWPDIQRADETPEYWRGIWDKGLRGFQTDHPAELVRWLKETGRR